MEWLRKIKSVVRRVLGHRQSKRAKRASWESRHSSPTYKAHWDIDRPPDQLVRLLDERQVDGPALDLGCGPGGATAYLAERIDFTVALDLSVNAVQRTGARVTKAGGRAHGLVAAAPELPFVTGALGLIYDRGCMHQMEVEVWPQYLLEIERCLRPGGVAQLLEKRRVTRARFAELLPAGLETERFDEIEGPMRDGRTTPFFEAVLVRRTSRQ